jgi:hypothetical protein
LADTTPTGQTEFFKFQTPDDWPIMTPLIASGSSSAQAAASFKYHGEDEQFASPVVSAETGEAIPGESGVCSQLYGSTSGGRANE